MENKDFQVLASSTSSSVIFYKYSTKNSRWKEYDNTKIPEVRGQIFYKVNKAGDRSFQLTDDDKIWFYGVDEDSLKI